MHCHSAPSVPAALPLGIERDAWYVHHRVAVNITLPLGPERTQIPSLHCHSAPSVPRPHPFTATRHRTYRLHCHSALNATCGTFTVDWQCELRCHSALNVMRNTFTIEWQCELHCHSAPSVLDHLAIISMSILRAGSRSRLYRSLGIKRQANRTVGALRPRSHVPTGQTILFSGGWELEHRR